MTYNFDEVIERRGTDSVKWDGVKSVWGRDDLLGRYPRNRTPAAETHKTGRNGASWTRSHAV